MLQDSISKIKYFLVLAFLLVVPVQAMAQFGSGQQLIDQTDTGVDRLIYYWDTRDRDTFMQLTNTSTDSVCVHVQIFNVDSGVLTCEEVDFDDCYTPNDTHVYDIENLASNCETDGLDTSPFSPFSTYCEDATDPDLTNSHGFMAISRIPDTGVPGSLIGMFRVIDVAGYEYRTNAAGEDLGADIADFNVLNFNDIDGTNLSDVIGISYISQAPDEVLAFPGLVAQFGSTGGDPPSPSGQVHVFDEFEDGDSCSPALFACIPGLFNRGIDNSLPNSKGQVNRICNESTLGGGNTAGWLFLPFNGFLCENILTGDLEPCDNFQFDPFFVGYLGLNNGDGTGSMDSWLSVDLFQQNGMIPLPPFETVLSQ